jgi:hypothetical protein
MINDPLRWSSLRHCVCLRAIEVLFHIENEYHKHLMQAPHARLRWR